MSRLLEQAQHGTSTMDLLAAGAYLATVINVQDPSQLNRVQVRVFNVDGVIYAMDNACLHQGLSLGTSQLDGKIVTCRGHGWKYDVTGQCIDVHA